MKHRPPLYRSFRLSGPILLIGGIVARVPSLTSWLGNLRQFTLSPPDVVPGALFFSKIPGLFIANTTNTGCGNVGGDSYPREEGLLPRPGVVLAADSFVLSVVCLGFKF